MEGYHPSALTMLFRGLTRRCPRCGEWHIFRYWVTMVERCPRCGLLFEREEGHWTGAMGINIGVTELVFLVVLATVVIWTWPDIPTVKLLVAGLALNGLVPIFFYPISKTLWVAIDLIIRPTD